MPGRCFDDAQGHLLLIADKLDVIIDRNDRGLSLEILNRFKSTKRMLVRCYRRVHRIDMLMTKDEGLETFLKSWDQETPVDDRKDRIKALCNSVMDAAEKQQAPMGAAMLANKIYDILTGRE